MGSSEWATRRMKTENHVLKKGLKKIISFSAWKEKIPGRYEQYLQRAKELPGKEGLDWSLGPQQVAAIPLHPGTHQALPGEDNAGLDSRLACLQSPCSSSF